MGGTFFVAVAPDPGGTTPIRGLPVSASQRSDVDIVRVLVVDDQPDIRMLLRHHAANDEDGGIRIVGEAADGRSAIEAAAQHRPDAIVLDVRMPKLDGISAIPALRAVAPGVRIVMYSSSEDRRDEALSRGADAWVAKRRGWPEVRRQLLQVLGDASR